MAAKLSTVLLKIAVEIVMAFAKLSLMGGVVLFTVNTAVCGDAPPPGGGFVTPIKKAPPNCSKVWLSVAVICVPAAFTKVVVTPEVLPSNVTVAFGAKPVPVTVIAVSVASTLTDAGTMVATERLLGARMENASAFEGFGCPGSVTVTCAVPGTSRLFEIVPVRTVGAPDASKFVMPADEPFQLICEFEVNPRPVTVSVKLPEPA